MEKSIHPARKELISKGIITPGTGTIETVPCKRCDTPFERIAGRTSDDRCGRRDCKDRNPPKPKTDKVKFKNGSTVSVKRKRGTDELKGTRS